MKPFLGIDLSENKKNEQMNGDEFIVARPNNVIAEAMEESSKDAVDIILKKSKLPIVFRVMQFIFGAIALLVVIGIIKAMTGEDSVTIAQAYKNAFWLFWVAGASLIFWVAFKIISSKKEKQVMESDESKNVFSDLDYISKNIYNELDIPADAAEVDILSFKYKIKNSNIKLCEKGMDITQYTNYIFKIIEDGEHMYLADIEAKYCFDLSSLVAIKKVNKHIRTTSWNKETQPNKGEYKQYKLAVDDFGCVTGKYYYILELEHNGEIWGIYFPCYEIETFKKITGLTPEQ